MTSTYAERTFATEDLSGRQVGVEVFIHFGLRTGIAFPTYCCSERIVSLQPDAACSHCRLVRPVPWGLTLTYCLTASDRTALRSRLEEILSLQPNVNVLETPLLADKITHAMSHFIDERREAISDEKRELRRRKINSISVNKFYLGEK